MRGKHHRLAIPLQLQNNVAHLAPAERVQPRHRLVQNDYFRIVEDRLRQPDALQHPLRVLAKLYLMRGIQPDLLQHALDAILPVSRGQVLKPGKITKHFRRGQIVVKVGLLGEITDLPVHFHVADRLAEDSCAPRRRENQPHQELDGR